jgi:hypothetical protein
MGMSRLDIRKIVATKSMHTNTWGVEESIGKDPTNQSVSTIQTSTK